MKWKKEYNFFKTTMPATRRADYYLGCLEGSVFIDFNVFRKSQIYLKRISFDGYGCCELSNFETKLDVKDSRVFMEQMEQDSLDQNIIEELVKKIIKFNEKQIWTDALNEYKLI